MDDEGKCYNMAPVVLPEGRQYYLKPGMKELVATARQINCAERPKFAFQIDAHHYTTTKAQQIVHSTPSVFDYEYRKDEKATKLNTDHFYTAQRISGLTAEESIQRQAQQLHEQKKLQWQMKRLVRVVGDYKGEEHIVVKRESTTQPRTDGWFSWITSRASAGFGAITYEILEGPVRFLIKIALGIVAVLVALLLLKCVLSCCCQAIKKWCIGRSRARQVATIAANDRRPTCRNCGAHGHTTADCIREARSIPLATRSPATENPSSTAVMLAPVIAGCAANTTHSTPRLMATQFAPYKVQSPLISIDFTPRQGRKVTTSAIIDTGATVSVCPENLIDKLGWTELATEAEEPLSLIGLGTEEAKTYVEGTLRIGEQLLQNVRLWIAPINVTKVLLGNDILSQVAKIELAYGNLKCFQVATVEGTEVEMKMQPDLIKEAVEHLKKLRAMDFGDTVLNTETPESVCGRSATRSSLSERCASRRTWNSRHRRRSRRDYHNECRRSA